MCFGMTEQRKTLHVRVTGKVQGVWYRAWTEKTARALGLDGWVRNCVDGSVEAVFSGPAVSVDQMVEAARDGPPMAQVAGVETTPADHAGLAGFEVRPDG